MSTSDNDDLQALHLGFLDWPEVLARLAERAESARGKESCLGLELAADRPEAEARMADVSEAAILLRAGQGVPSLGFPDVEIHLDAVEQGAALGAEELKQVAAFCETVDAAKRSFSRLAEDAVTPGPRAPRLSGIAEALGSHDHLMSYARETFDAAGEIRDSASPDLMRLRRERDGLSGRAREQAETLLKSEEYAPYLQDEYVTLREDRFVLPLRASFKSMGLGIVHDTSRTGETVFVEPSRMVELNNRLKVVEIDIRRESRRILEELATAVAGAAPVLRADREILTRLDVIMAGARLSVAYDGAAVTLADDPVLDVRELRHPLLALRARAEAEAARGRARTGAGGKGVQVVPNDLMIGESVGGSAARVLVVSGPNAGGKTVLLKAAGLAVLLARAGLHVPASASSRVGFFHAVLADIGDQQSVTGDLSTFSAHLANVAAILGAAGLGSGEGGGDGVGVGESQPNLLVLLDELMSGTHPEQGAALARATLEALGAGRALVIATTHYDSLKALTEGDARFRNAGMEYDIEHLRPTFRLKDGLPGRSYALDIATRMGLPEPVLARARELVGATTLGLEDVLRGLETREAALASAAAGLDDARAELERQSTDQKVAAQALVKRERELAVRSRDVLDRAVREARDAINEVVREMRRVRTRDAVETARRAIEVKAAEAAAHLPDRPSLDVDRLREALAARALGVSPGAAGRGAAKKPASPAAGRGPAATKGKAASSDAPEGVSQTRWNTVDVRGARADEAIGRIEEFLDRCALDGADTVVVIHGHGTGALRKAVREYLAISPYVQRFRPGGAGEGGDGVSVVTVKG